jgi:hypothetical protein
MAVICLKGLQHSQGARIRGHCGRSAQGKLCEETARWRREKPTRPASAFPFYLQVFFLIDRIHFASASFRFRFASFGQGLRSDFPMSLGFLGRGSSEFEVSFLILMFRFVFEGLVVICRFCFEFSSFVFGLRVSAEIKFGFANELRVCTRSWLLIRLVRE